MWETIELREIRVFLVLAEELHFGRTGERLGISQSRVSQTIRQLEAEVGGKLVDRTSRCVSLTPFGERLVDELRGPITALGQVLAGARDRSGRLEGEIRIALLTPLARGPYFLDIVRRFRRLYPDCIVIVRDGISPGIIDAVQSDEVDLLVSWLPVHAAYVECGPILAEEPRVLAVARDHPLAERDSVSLEDIADYPVADMQWVFPSEISDEFAPQSSGTGRLIRRVQINLGISGLSELIARGDLVHPTVGCYPTYFGNSGIVVIPISGLPPMRSALLWRRDRASHQGIRAFVGVVNEVISTRRQRSG